MGDGCWSYFRLAAGARGRRQRPIHAGLGKPDAVRAAGPQATARRLAVAGRKISTGAWWSATSSVRAPHSSAMSPVRRRTLAGLACQAMLAGHDRHASHTHALPVGLVQGAPSRRAGAPRVPMRPGHCPWQSTRRAPDREPLLSDAHTRRLTPVASGARGDRPILQRPLEACPCLSGYGQVVLSPANPIGKFRG